MGKGETSIVELEGVMTDVDVEISDFHSILFTQDLPTQYTADASESRQREADRHTPNYAADASESRQSEADQYALRLGVQNDRFVDAITVLPLDKGLCRIGRRREIDYFKSKRV